VLTQALAQKVVGLLMLLMNIQHTVDVWCWYWNVTHPCTTTTTSGIAQHVA
jgi:hypothetical protein